MIFFVFACLIPSFLVSVIVTGLMKKISPLIGLMDHPASRKVHVTPTPLGGGIGIWAGVVIPIAVAQLAAWILSGMETPPSWFPAELVKHLDGVAYRAGTMWMILGAGTILSLMGLIDDIKNLPWLPRLLIQVGVVIGLVFFGVRATIFSSYAFIGAIISVFWILGLINSFNFLDNMDSLSSGIALISASIFAIIMLTATSEPHWLVAGVLLILSGSLMGFLCHNKPPASIFMGDTGSYFIGLIMASMTILGTFYDSSTGSRHVILAPLCILAIPLYDTISVILIRLLEKRSPFKPDKSHFSHRLVEMGLTSRHAVMTVHFATLTTGIGALLLYQVEGWTGACMIIALIFCVLMIVAILETVGRKTDPDS